MPVILKITEKCSSTNYSVSLSVSLSITKQHKVLHNLQENC